MPGTEPTNRVFVSPERCVCGGVPKAEMRPHYVHGHLACGVCGRNVAECCSGEVCEVEGDAEIRGVH